MTTITTTTPTTTPGPTFHPAPERVSKAVARRSFATLASVSPQGWPHVAGVLYELVDRHLYISTDRSSRKARNIASNPHVGVAIPIRRLPVGPPSTLHFQAEAEVLDVDDHRVRRLVDAGALKSITGHGELERPDGCILLITPPARVFTYGLGMSLVRLVREPLDAAGVSSLG